MSVFVSKEEHISCRKQNSQILSLVTANKYDCVLQKSLSVLHVNSYFSENIKNIFTCLSEIKEHIMKHQKVFPCQVFYLCFLIVWVFFSFAPNWALLHHQLLCSGLLIFCNNFFVFQLVIPSSSIYHPVWVLYSILWSCHCKLFAQMESDFFLH